MRRSWRIFVLGATLCAGLVGVGCDAPTGSGEGPGHRAQDLALSPQQELELGRQAYRQVLTNPRQYGRPVAADRPEVQRVRGIAERIVHAAGIEPLQREMHLRKGYRYEWEVNVLESGQVNAFCLPGGKMVVFRGLLKVARKDDHLATVIAHEMAHALAHHASERVAREEQNRGAPGGFWNRAYDREQEAEADHIGLFLMTFAGYDPADAVRFWELMEQATGGRQQLPEILSDHPSNAHRIQNLKEWVPKAKAAKQAFDQGRVAPPR
jgi:predicted Zn-dependent protease